MKSCPSCGSNNPDETFQCQQCGTSLSPLTVAEIPRSGPATSFTVIGVIEACFLAVLIAWAIVALIINWLRPQPPLAEPAMPVAVRPSPSVSAEPSASAEAEASPSPSPSKKASKGGSFQTSSKPKPSPSPSSADEDESPSPEIKPSPSPSPRPSPPLPSSVSVVVPSSEPSPSPSPSPSALPTVSLDGPAEYEVRPSSAAADAGPYGTHAVVLGVARVEKTTSATTVWAFLANFTDHRYDLSPATTVLNDTSGGLLEHASYQRPGLSASMPPRHVAYLWPAFRAAAGREPQELSVELQGYGKLHVPAQPQMTNLGAWDSLPPSVREVLETDFRANRSFKWWSGN